MAATADQRNTLTVRAVLVTCAVAVISVVVTALISIPLTVRAAERTARTALADQADVAAELLRLRIRSANPNDEVLVVAVLRQRTDIDLYFIRLGFSDRAGLPQRVVDDVANDRRVSNRRIRIGGRSFWVEGRPLGKGYGVILVRPATRVTLARILARLWFPLLTGLAAGVLAGVLLARRLTRPIRTAAIAATRLSAGDRTVRVPVEPPVEAADLARAINDLAAALALSEGRQREFLMSISHELRTPLTTIRGYAEALADGVVSPDAAARTGQTLLTEAERLDRLVSDLLALSRLEADDFPLESMPVDLAALVSATADAWSARCANAGVPLRLEKQPAAACGDPGRLRQVLDGLIENALRVVPAGAPLVLASFGSTLEVRDGGPGLSDEDLAVAFQRGALHKRYRGSRAVGSGLGLALVERLVRRLGGSIEAGHAAEGGARFTVRLPAVDRAADGTSIAAPSAGRRPAR